MQLCRHLDDRRFALITTLLALVFNAGALGQERPEPGKPIDIDKALQTRKPEDRAASYYYFALAKWHEESGDLTRALAEMRKAKQSNEDSSILRVALASLLYKTRNAREAVEECQEAVRIDPNNAEAYWLLAYFYSNEKEKPPNRESLRKAIQELEKMRELVPGDERAYFALGGFYLELGETDKGIAAYEKFQELRPDTDAGYSAIAEYFQKQGEHDRAIEYLTKALKAQPESLKSMMMLASLYTQKNNDKDAIPVFKKILKQSGDNLAVKRQLGASLVDTGQFQEAIQVLEEVVKSSPEDGFALTQLGRAQMGARQFSEAINTFRAVLRANPRNLEAEFYLGTCFEQKGEPREAAKVFSELLQKTKPASGALSEEQKNNRALFQQHLALAYQDLGENEKAIAIYEEMIAGEADPNPHYLFLLVNAYRLNRDLEKALTLGKQFYEKDPKEAALGLVYARALADSGKTGQGADIISKLIQQDPSNLDLYINLSQIHLQGKRYTDAERAVRRAQEKEPDNERFKFQLGSIYERQKDFDRAESLFKEIIQANPENAGALNYLGYMLADRGIRLQEAVGYVERALKIEPNNGAYLDSLGWAFFKLNDFGQAEKYLLQAVETVKNDPVIHDHLGDVYFKTGDYQKAQDFWSKSITIGAEPEERQKIREKIDKLKELRRKQKSH